MLDKALTKTENKVIERKPEVKKVENKVEKKDEEKRAERRPITRPSRLSSADAGLAWLVALGFSGILLIGAMRGPQNNVRLRRETSPVSKSFVIQNGVEAINRQSMLEQAQKLNLLGLDPNNLIISQDLADELNKQIDQQRIEKPLVQGLLIHEMNLLNDLQNLTVEQAIFDKIGQIKEVNDLLQAMANTKESES